MWGGGPENPARSRVENSECGNELAIHWGNKRVLVWGHNCRMSNSHNDVSSSYSDVTITDFQVVRHGFRNNSLKENCPKHFVYER